MVAVVCFRALPSPPRSSMAAELPYVPSKALTPSWRTNGVGLPAPATPAGALLDEQACASQAARTYGVAAARSSRAALGALHFGFSTACWTVLDTEMFDLAVEGDVRAAHLLHPHRVDRWSRSRRQPNKLVQRPPRLSRAPPE